MAARKKKPLPTHVWYTANLSPLAKGIFTDSFYPTPQENGDHQIFFTQVSITELQQKVITVSKMAEVGIRMMTRELAMKCLIPLKKATKLEMAELNSLTQKLKI